MTRIYDSANRKKNFQDMLAKPIKCSRCNKQTTDVIDVFDFCRDCTTESESRNYALSFLTKEMHGLKVEEKQFILREIFDAKRSEIRNQKEMAA
jgi:hypothetical protein